MCIDTENAVKQIGDTNDRFSRDGYFDDKQNLNLIGAIVSTGNPANAATYQNSIMPLSITSATSTCPTANATTSISRVLITPTAITKLA